jgi:hypothetical protein
MLGWAGQFEKCPLSTTIQYGSHPHGHSCALFAFDHSRSFLNLKPLYSGSPFILFMDCTCVLPYRTGTVQYGPVQYSNFRILIAPQGPGQSGQAERPPCDINSDTCRARTARAQEKNYNTVQVLCRSTGGVLRWNYSHVKLGTISNKHELVNVMGVKGEGNTVGPR